jgi:hypothetical protein
MSAWEQWRRPAAAWHELLAPLPPDATVHRGPLAGTEGLDAAALQPIDGWEQLSVNMTAEGSGLRHVLVVVNGAGKPISIGDAVLYRSIVSALEADQTAELSPGQIVFFHENVGGRLEEDGSFRGTRWQAFCVQGDDEDDLPIQSSTPAAPTQAEVSALKALVSEVLRRAAIAGN